jgi:DeoR family transcriptional regulator, aga operon transcriptional repressor
MKELGKENTVSRRKKIMNEVLVNGQVYVNELSKEFNVSEVTIRNDLDQLEKKNMLVRARGGALCSESNVSADNRLSDKAKLHHDEKSRIGKCAAKLINDYDTIIIDSGTTTMEIIKNLPEVNELNIITNALNIVNHLVAQNNPNVNIIMLGGYLRKNSLSLVGPLADKNLMHLFVDKVFLAIDGFDIKYGVYTPNIEEAYINQKMIEVAKEVILVADSSKFQRKSMGFICETSRIHTVVTDDGISDEDSKRLTDLGIKLIIA